MRLCVPTTDQGGRHGRVAYHFGRAPYYTLVDADSGAAEVVANAHGHHAPGQCETAEDLRERGVNAVLCRAMGKRSLVRLTRSGIAVLATEADTVIAAIEAFRAGVVHPLTPQTARGAGLGGRQRRGETMARRGRRRGSPPVRDRRRE